MQGARQDVSQDDAVRRLFAAALHITWSWMSPPVVRDYLRRASVGVGPSQYQALVVIAGDGPVRLRDVAARTGMTSSNASKIVTELVDAGLVTRRVPTSDRRVTLLEPTDGGRRAVESLGRVGRQMLAERLEGFEPDEVDILGRLLERLVAATDGWTSTLENEDRSTLDNEDMEEKGEGAA
ncbi:MAG TPA: MarR family winged helix-turn-helix transcriptional regulator [Acidimicrobiales bacterium]|nr:MarR family winged helix-turn-helix transcriptional regulator [Acidimicrobiales bacterium]